MEHHKWHERGLASFSEGDFVAARSALRRACQLDPGNVRYLVDYGLVFVELGIPQKAKILFSLALQRDPQCTEARFQLGNLFKSFSQLERAIEEYNTALALDPTCARILNNRGGALHRLGDHAAARDDFLRAIAADPTLEPAYLNLGRLLDTQGDFAGAIGIYEQAIQRSVNPAMFQHLVDSLREASPTKAPVAYVRSVFDDLAPVFDNHLIDDLGYSLPDRIAEALDSLAPGAFPTQILVDLGCGTGLVGQRLSTRFQHLVGVDLSTRMLDQAEKKNVYHELIEGDAIAYLEQTTSGTLSALVAADMLIYVGDLQSLFMQASRCLSRHGLLVLSTEKLSGPQDYQLKKTGRFAHSSEYLRKLGAASELTLVVEEEFDLRKEADSVISGSLFVFRNSGTSVGS